MTNMPPATRRRAGLIFLGSAGLMLLLAVVFAAGVFQLPPPTRAILAGAFGVAGIVEGFIGVRFLGESS